MNINPRLEVGILNGEIVGYGCYKFVCRLLIPTYRSAVAVEWLQSKDATVLVTYFEKPYFTIIFATDNQVLVRSINNKYKASKVDARTLYKKIKENQERIDEEPSNSSIEYESSYEDYYQDVEKKIYEYMEDYSNAMVNSSEEGWFYAEPDYET